MKNAPHLRSAALFGGLLLLTSLSVGAHAAPAAGEGDWETKVQRRARLGSGVCCVAPASTLPEWMYMIPDLSTDNWAARLQRRSAGNGHHLQFKPDYHNVPTGLADRLGMRRRRGSTYALAGLGASYPLAPGLRATTNWATGVGRYSVVPGHQFSLGVAFKY